MNAQVGFWQEVHIAAQVARLGTLSAAADFLGLHHATVMRNIDALEARLEVKLFQRHARGYTPTDAGKDLLNIAQITDDQLAQFAARVKGQRAEVSGDLIITTVSGLADTLTPVLAEFAEKHPAIRLQVISDARRLRLERGEAHVALRAGPKPQEPDCIPVKLSEISVALFAAPDYIKRNGAPQTVDELAEHRVIGSVVENSRAPHNQWLAEHVPEDAIVYRCNEVYGQQSAVLNGIGIGFLGIQMASNLPVQQVLTDNTDWVSTLWLVTHVDLHRTAKVQAISNHLKSALTL